MASGYRDAVESLDRKVDIFISIGTDQDLTSADDVTAITSDDTLPMSNPNQLIDANYGLTPVLATYEAYGIPTAVSAGMIVPPLQTTAYPPETGLWSKDISDVDGAIDFEINLSLSAKHTSALTIYTDGPDILAGTVTFSYDGTDEVVNLTAHNGYAVATGPHDYDAITINITAIDGAYQHLRIAEIEFGDAISIGMDKVAGEVTFIDEIDPLMTGMPLSELDFELVNILGDYDEDKPNTMYSRLAIGNPVNLAYTVTENGVKYTVIMARLTIGERSSTQDRLLVRCYDVRWYLSQTYQPWALDMTEDLGTTLTNLFTTLGQAYYIDDSLFSIYPESDYTFTEESTVLDDIMKVAQAYGLVFLPTRRGTIQVLPSWPGDDYGTVPVLNVYKWPSSAQMRKYNYLDIRYGTTTYNRYTYDIRDDPNTAKNILTVNNDLIVSYEMAVATATRLLNQIYASAVEMDWRGDPAMDLGDTLNLYTRWTQNTTPASYKSVKRELTYDGSLREVTTFIQ